MYFLCTLILLDFQFVHFAHFFCTFGKSVFCTFFVLFSHFEFILKFALCGGSLFSTKSPVSAVPSRAASVRRQACQVYAHGLDVDRLGRNLQPSRAVASALTTSISTDFGHALDHCFRFRHVGFEASCRADVPVFVKEITWMFVVRFLSAFSDFADFPCCGLGIRTS